MSAAFKEAVNKLPLDPSKRQKQPAKGKKDGPQTTTARKLHKAAKATDAAQKTSEQDASGWDTCIGTARIVTGKRKRAPPKLDYNPDDTIVARRQADEKAKKKAKGSETEAADQEDTSSEEGEGGSQTEPEEQTRKKARPTFKAGYNTAARNSLNGLRRAYQALAAGTDPQAAADMQAAIVNAEYAELQKGRKKARRNREQEPTSFQEMVDMENAAQPQPKANPQQAAAPPPPPAPGPYYQHPAHYPSPYYGYGYSAPQPHVHAQPQPHVHAQPPPGFPGPLPTGPTGPGAVAADGSTETPKQSGNAELEKILARLAALEQTNAELQKGKKTTEIRFEAFKEANGLMKEKQAAENG